MAQVEMFAAKANSPATELAAALTISATTVSVLDASKLPDAPNIATIGVDESAETVRYEGKSGNDLTGVTRGFSGTVAKAWGVGSGVARYFTAYDADALRENVADVNAQLADIATNTVHLSSIKRLPGETDDAGRLQRAIDSFLGNIAGTIIIAETIRISSQVTCNKTGLYLLGVSNKQSRIISSYAGISLFIKPLLDGVPYTNPVYCKFYMDNIAIQAEGDAVTSGTGLWLQWVYSCSFNNLLTTGFKKHIVLKGSHVNTFNNLFQSNTDVSEEELPLFNQGVGLSADGSLDEAGETTSNNNHIIGGWLHNSSYNFTYSPGTIVEKIDIEPASNSIITGDGAVFKSCRFERFDYYIVFGNHYVPFPWFTVGSKCVFTDNEYHQSGASQTFDYPVFKILGDFNKIDVPDEIPYNAGFMTLGEGAKGNEIAWNGLFRDYQRTLLNPDFKQEYVTILYNDQQNRFVYKDRLQGTITDVVGSNTRAQGEFTSRNSRNKNLVNNEDYAYQDCVSSAVDITLPIGRALGTTSFTKITLSASSGNRRMLLYTPNAQTAPVSGVYALTATVYIPSTSSTFLKIGPTLGVLTNIYARDKWLTVRSRVYLNSGELIQPCFQMDGVSGDKFYVGEISVCDGNCSAYIENDTYGAVSAAF